MKRLRKVFKWLWNHKRFVLWLIILDTIVELTLNVPLWVAIDRLTAIAVIFIVWYVWKRRYKQQKGRQRRLSHIPPKRRSMRRI